MIHKTTYLKLLAFVVIAITCFTTCKKYPENYLWFKNPEKLILLNGYITEYKINGIDSLNGFNVYINRNAGITKNLNQFEFIESKVYAGNIDSQRENNKGRVEVGLSGHNIGFGYQLLSKQKKINILSGLGGPPNPSINNETMLKKNIFVENGLTWDIMKLTRKGKLKIKTTYNGNTYEIQFN